MSHAKILAAALLAAAAGALCAAPADEAPRKVQSTVSAQPEANSGATAAKRPKAQSDAANPLLPTKEDYEHARADREAGKVPPKFDRQTKIEAVRDENNRVTEYVVTPGSTQIPYTMENRADRPIDGKPGANSMSTLGNTKQIRIGF